MVVTPLPMFIVIKLVHPENMLDIDNQLVTL